MRKRGKYYWRQFFSYILILLIPVCLGIFFYFYAYHVVKGQTDASNQTFLQNVRKTCDRELQYTGNYMMQLLANEKIAEICSDNQWLARKRDWNISTLCGDVRELYMASNRAGDFCKDIFVYFKEQDVVVSSRGTMKLDFYIQYYCVEESEKKELFEETLKEKLLAEQPENMVSLPAKWSSDFSSLLLLRPAVRKGNAFQAIMGIWLDVDSLNDRIISGAWDESLEWAAVDGNHQAILSSANLDGLSLSLDELEEKESCKQRWNGENYLISAIPSNTYDLSYVIMMPETLITGVTDKVRNFFIVAQILCLASVVLLLQYLMRLNYNPLQKLVELFSLPESGGKGIEGEESDRENEYLYLEEKVKGLFEERSRFRQELGYMEHAVKEYYLSDLMKTPFDMLDNTPETDHIRKQFRGQGCMVLLLKMEKYTGEDEQEVISTNSLRRFIVRNVFEEGVGEYYFQRTVNMGDTVSMVVQLERTDHVQDDIRGVVERYQNFIRQHFQFRVWAVAGGVHENCEGIHLSYEEACRAAEFLKWEDVDYISYRDVGAEMENHYDYSLEMEEHIIAAVADRNQDAALSMLEKVLDANILLNKESPDLILGLIYDLCGTLRRAAGRMGLSQRELAGLNRISGKNSLEENREILQQAVKNLTEELERAGETAQGRELCEKVLTYVREHYSDPDLNVAQTGIYFNLTPAYLSAMLKKQTGRSLLKIISDIRIEEAKKLLSQGVSVQEVGRRTGFRDSSTFIRLFKQVVGVTPGQFREIDKKGK